MSIKEAKGSITILSADEQQHNAMGKLRAIFPGAEIRISTSINQYQCFGFKTRTIFHVVIEDGSGNEQRAMSYETIDRAVFKILERLELNKVQEYICRRFR